MYIVNSEVMKNKIFYLNYLRLGRGGRRDEDQITEGGVVKLKTSLGNKQ